MEKIEYIGIIFIRPDDGGVDIKQGTITGNFLNIYSIIDEIHDINKFEDIDYVEIYQLIDGHPIHVSFYIPNKNRKIYKNHELKLNSKSIESARPIVDFVKYTFL